MQYVVNKVDFFPQIRVDEWSEGGRSLMNVGKGLEAKSQN
jgi:hypothetical protein